MTGVHKKRTVELRHTQRVDHARTQREHRQLHTKERGLRRNQSARIYG